MDNNPIQPTDPNTNPTPEQAPKPTPEPIVDTPAAPETDAAEPVLNEAIIPEEAPAEPVIESPAEPATPDSSINFNAEPISSSEEVSPEPIAPSFAPEPKKKSNVLTLLFAFIAVLGIGFGVYGMFLQPAKEKVVYKTVETTSDNESDNASPSLIASSDYLYISDWGLKIKLPTAVDTSRVSYSYDSSDPNGSFLRIWGQKTGTSIADFANPEKNAGGLVTLSIVSSDYGCEASCPTLITLKTGEKIAVGHPQAVYSTDAASSAEEQEVVSALFEALTNPDNYSEF
ncbi:hypothetical protein IJF86_02190 [Candidatus Saccharibacteria bacterium]|nr:hypothetical protein [Candidatus Saccharibacteria bacterium]